MIAGVNAGRASPMRPPARLHGAGAIRVGFGDYRVAFWMAGGRCALAGLSFLTGDRRTFVGRSPVALPSVALQG